MTISVRTIESAEGLQAIAHPLRSKVLESLREPASAAAVARRLGQPRQKINYHLKQLAQAGLVEHAGEQRKGNFIEQLYQSVARRFVISPAVTWDPEELAAAVRDQVALSHLAQLGDRIQRDATALLDQASRDGDRIPTSSMEAEVAFEDQAARSAFMNEYLSTLTNLLDKYGHRQGEQYRVSIMIYPDPGATTPTEVPDAEQ